jgi:hypothetical protein
VSDGPGIKQIETRLPGPPKRFDALTRLEKLQRTNAKTDPSVATKMLSAVGDFDLKKRKLEFDFDTIQILGLKIPLQQGQAAQLGAKSGLGSEGNVELAKRNRQAFFNWISADDTIATARGGGGGLALWKRVDE